MKKKFNISLSLLFAVLALGSSMSSHGQTATADKRPAPLQLAADAPSRYEVKKGDTLWSIAGRFLKSPWRWNELWRMNKDQIRNPHWIYPGNVLVLTRGADGEPRLSVAAAEDRPTIRVPLQQRSTPIGLDAIPSIPPAVIDPFLTKPLVIEENGLAQAPKIVGAADARVVLAPGYKIYATGIGAADGASWQIYRPGPRLVSPAKDETLGFEAEYLGDAVVDKHGDVATLTILSSRKEILVGDRLVQVPKERIVSYPPHSPEKKVDGRVIGMPTSLIESGRDAVVTLDVGSRDGIEIGHVLAMYHNPGRIELPDQKGSNFAFWKEKETLPLPLERIGLAFVFRVFDKVSYALVLNTSKQVELGDRVQQP